MTTEPICKASLETQSVIFNRAFIGQAAKIASEFNRAMSDGKTHRVDMTKSPWWFIVDERNSCDALNLHVLEQAWEKFEQYFLQKKE